MAEYISKEALINVLDDHQKKLSGKYATAMIWDYYIDNLKECILRSPGADVVDRQWIPALKQLPEEGEKTLLLYDNGKISGGKYIGEKMWEVDFPDLVKTTKIIAWIPLPEPYQEQEDE